MDHSKPKVAIALATYNPVEKYFQEQIESLQKQSYDNWVCTVSDDHSDSQQIKFISYLLKKDTRFQLVSNTGDKGSYGNFQNALGNIDKSADLIAFCDQDDVWEVDKLEKSVSLFLDAKTMVVHTDLSLTDKNGNVTDPSCWEKEQRDFISKDFYSLFLRNNVTGCSMMFRKDLLKWALPFPRQNFKDLSFHHDHWIALIGHLKGEIKRIDSPLIRYRQHDHNVVGVSVREKKSLLNKIKDLQFLLEKSVKAYNQRQTLYLALVSRFPESKDELGKWPSFLCFFLDIIKRAVVRPPMRRVSVQLILGRLGKRLKQKSV